MIKARLVPFGPGVIGAAEADGVAVLGVWNGRSRIGWDSAGDWAAGLPVRVVSTAQGYQYGGGSPCTLCCAGRRVRGRRSVGPGVGAAVGSGEPSSTMSDPLFCSRCFSSRFASRLRTWPKMPGFKERQGAARAWHNSGQVGAKQRRDGGHSAGVRHSASGTLSGYVWERQRLAGSVVLRRIGRENDCGARCKHSQPRTVPV